MSEENNNVPLKVQNRKNTNPNRRFRSNQNKKRTEELKTPETLLNSINKEANQADASDSLVKRSPRQKTKSRTQKNQGGKIRIIPLGGLNEIGKNMTVVECNDEIIIIDCGVAFPDDEMPGIDLVIPETTYLEANRDKIKGMVLTHGHEDHIGAIPYFLRSFDIPIYGTPLTLGIIKNKLVEHKLPFNPSLNTVHAGDIIKLGCFSVEFIRVNHSIADACCLAITTPVGTIVHTGDFKVDFTPTDGGVMDITRLGEIGRKGVLLLMCESTNAERPGFTPSEKIVGKSFENVFNANPDKRIVIATFSSNVYRVQEIINVSAKHGRKVAITGRSMLNVIGAATELGYMKLPAGVLIDINEIKKYKPEQTTLITTGSQGEPMSALYRMAFSDHNQVTLGRSDLVILSSSAIPGNEKLVGRVINELSKNGVTVLHDAILEIHVSGHACKEELKLMQTLIKPKYFMPVHGEARHLIANKQIALSLGTPDSNIFISDIGKVLELDRNSAKLTETVPSGKVLIDGLGVGDVGNIVLRDRKHLSEDGLIVLVAAIDMKAGFLLSGPDIVSRGFVYVRESEELIDEIKKIALKVIDTYLKQTVKQDRMQLKTKLSDEISKYLYTKTKRRPMVLPVIMYL